MHTYSMPLKGQIMEGVKASSRCQGLADRHNAETGKCGVVSFQPSADCEAMDLGRKEDQGEMEKVASLHSSPSQASADTSPSGSLLWLLTGKSLQAPPLKGLLTDEARENFRIINLPFEGKGNLTFLSPGVRGCGEGLCR